MNKVSCDTCKLYDSQFQGCTALTATDFGDRSCPFYKPMKQTKLFDKAICQYCFANKGKCTALIKPPRFGKCRFFKTPEQFAADNAAALERVEELSKANPKLYTKYHF